MEETVVESGYERLVESIQSELKIIRSPPPRVISAGVLRVPENIKQLNEKLYKPTLISIGPVYHGQPEYKAMEDFKKRYFLSFFGRESSTVKSIDYYLGLISESENRLREDYAIDSLKIPREEFLMIMLIDFIFLWEFLQCQEMGRMSYKKWKDILSDMLLLENQIPFHLLLKLSDPYNLTQLIAYFLRETLPYYNDNICYSIRRTLFRSLYNCVNEGSVNHLLDCAWILMQGTVKERTVNNLKRLSLPLCPTVLELHKAGVKFRPNFFSFDLKFRHGVLEIPTLKIDDIAASFFANLMALELTKGQDSCVTDYVVMMDYLIDCSEDIELLIRYEIIKNSVKDTAAAASLINELGKNIDVRPEFCYSDVVEQLNKYCKRGWIKWKVEFLYEWKMDLKKTYFSNPWKALSVIAAVILLILTTIQTVCSLLQLK